MDEFEMMAFEAEVELARVRKDERRPWTPEQMVIQELIEFLRSKSNTYRSPTTKASQTSGLRVWETEAVRTAPDPLQQYRERVARQRQGA